MIRTVVTGCDPDEDSWCGWVGRKTGNDTLADVADWFFARPAKIVLILLVAWILRRIIRRIIRRWVPRLYEPHEPARERLERLGINVPDIIAAELTDPRRHARGESITAALSSTVGVAVWVIALLMVLGVTGLDIAPLLAGAGVAGVALGFGAQSIVRDCLAGLFMLIEDQYGIGDVVDLGEASGVVEQIHLRTTVVRGSDGTVWHVPNGVVQRVGNKSQLWSVAVLDANVAYRTDLTRARELLHQAADEVCASDQFRASVIDAPEVLGVESLGVDGVTLRLIVKVQPGTQWALQRALREHVKEVFDAGGIEIPFPQRTVWTRVAPTAPAGGDSTATAPEPTDGAT
ncbi:MAG TPA: mechanosensitive ion channel family protein [Ilumatobacter sp.]|nr:mechanosensitive ion channel family protein [Ilumatobacter sp.]